MKSYNYKLIIVFLYLLICNLVFGQHTERDLDEILKSGTIKIGLREREFVYLTENENQFNYLLAKEFAQFLNVKTELIFIDNLEDYWKDSNGKINTTISSTPTVFNTFDIACDIISPIEWRTQMVDIIDFIPNTDAVIATENAQINTLIDLKNHKGLILKGSSYEEFLKHNAITNYKYADIQDILPMINRGEADYTILGNAIYSLTNYPELEAKFSVTKAQKVGWALRKNQPKLNAKVREFIDIARKTGLLDELFKKQTGMTMSNAEHYISVLQETSQTGHYPYVFYNTRDGLPHENILDIHQDKNGYIWFATSHGLARYNGREMLIFNKSDGLLSDMIYAIEQDYYGDFYIVSSKGIQVFKENSFQTISHKKGYSNIFIDRDNNKWFYGNSGVILKKSNQKDNVIELSNAPKPINSVSQSGTGTIVISGSGKCFVYKGDKLSQIPIIQADLTFIDKENRIWFASGNKLFLSEKETLYRQKTEMNYRLGLPEMSIQKISQTADGSIMIMGDSEIYQILAINRKAIIKYDELSGLKPFKINCLEQDSEGNLWFGMLGGVQKLTNRSIRIMYPQKINTYSFDFKEDNSGKIWFNSTKGLYSFKNDLQFLGQFSDYELFNDKIYAVSSNTLKVVNAITNEEINSHTIDEDVQSVAVFGESELILKTTSGKFLYYNDLNAKPKQIETEIDLKTNWFTIFDGQLLAGTNQGLFKVDFFRFIPVESGSKEFITWSYLIQDDVLWMGTDRGLARFEDNKVSFIEIENFSDEIVAIELAKAENYLWIGTNSGVKYYNQKTQNFEFSIGSSDGLYSDAIAHNGLLIDNRGLLWIGTYHGLATFDLNKLTHNNKAVSPLIENIFVNNATNDLSGKLSYDENSIIFELTANSFANEKAVVYDYHLEGLAQEKEIADKKYKAVYTNLPPGNYAFHYRAKGKNDLWSEPKTIDFKIDKPVWMTWWFTILMLTLIAIAVYFGMKWRFAIMRRRNEVLMEMVKQRTLQIEKQKQDIEQQKQYIEVKNQTLEETNKAIALRNEYITSSIRYALTIQQSILPLQERIDEILDSFIIYKPKDIVSGDFYWMMNFPKLNKLFIAAVDCTGHGVPGAFMSMIGSRSLTSIVTDLQIYSPAQILDHMNADVVKSLKQEKTDNNDGMDVCLCCLEKFGDETKLTYAGAKRPLYYVKSGEDSIQIQKGDIKSIGGRRHRRKMDVPYSDKVLTMKRGDMIYLSSDGYVDQNAPDRKKFGSKRLMELLKKIYPYPNNYQKQELEKALDEHRAGQPQRDDICVWGVRI